MMKFVGLVLKRQRHYLGLTLLALLNIVLAVGLITNASFFSQAVDRVILNQVLERFSQETGRPPFSTSVYLFPSLRYPVTLEAAGQISHQIAQILSEAVGLPVRHLRLQISSGGLMLLPKSSPGAEELGILNMVKVVYLEGVSGHMEIVEGQPLDEGDASDDALDVWLHEKLAQKMGAHPGEFYGLGISLGSRTIPVRLAGFWRAREAKDPFWFTNPDLSLADAFLVRKQDYIRFVQPLIPSGSREVSWYIILEDSQIIPKNSASYLEGFKRGLMIINRSLHEARLNTPPLAPLNEFVQRSQTLTILLLSYNLPAFGILLYYLILTSAIIAQWQRKETTLMVSRGMSGVSVLSLTLLEQLLLFVVGVPLGIASGMAMARLMGYSASFLTFTQRAPLPVSLQGLSLPLTGVALVVSLLARLLPVFQASRGSVVTEEREWARPLRSPFVYRFYVDFLLLLPTFYVYDQMMKRGSLAGMIENGPEDLFRDPLLILVPAFFMLTISMVVMRLFSWVMYAIDLLARLVPFPTIHLTLLQLGRQRQDYVKPLLLIIVSLAMGVYTLSMAASLDQWLVDRTYYQNGAELIFTPQPNVEGTEYIDGNWIPEPGMFQSVDGVAQATRVGDYFAAIRLSAGSEIRGRFLAIDRYDFPKVAWFRPDFARESLGAMMNRLALVPNGVLVSDNFLATYGLQIGSQLSINVSIMDALQTTSDFTIVGIYHHFPTVYEENQVTVIGNLDYFLATLGFTLPHDIWLKLEPGASGASVLKAIPGSLSIRVSREKDTQAIIAEEQAKMERVGIFGTLSIGFLMAVFMSILGLLIYSYASMRERIVRLAVLNALGWERRQIITQVVLEYFFLAVAGSLFGSLIGVAASRLFVPFFRFTGEQGTPLPPLLPIIAEQRIWNLSLTIGIIIILAEMIIVASSLRQRLAKFIKFA